MPGLRKILPHWALARIYELIGLEKKFTKGARNAGMDQVFCNYFDIPHDGEVTFKIKEMLELKNIL